MRVTAQFALADVAPDAALAVWGARLNVEQNGHTDLLRERLSNAGGAHSRTLTDLIDDRFPIAAIRDTISDLLRAGILNVRQRQDVILYLDERLVVHANTLGSHGYCYVTAWLTDPTPALILRHRHSRRGRHGDPAPRPDWPRRRLAHGVPPGSAGRVPASALHAGHRRRFVGCLGE